ncbi:MAG: tetratricopeptide repeat protein [Planctomycetes bacterium]|nr:tetratricopeptide repeat protein [Planctomycetota bacterium]
MLGLTLYMRGFIQIRTAVHDSIFPRWQTWTAVFACYLVAVAFKAPAVTLPFILLLVDVFPLRRVHLFQGFDLRRWAHVLIEKLPFFFVAIAAAFLAIKAKDFNESRMPFSDWSADQRLAQSAYGILFYVWKSLWPTGLAAYYELPNNLSLGVWPFNAMAGAVVVITTLVALFARRAPGTLIAWLAYLILLAPNLGIVQFSQQIAADRYAYFATMPLFVLLAAVLCCIAEGALMPWPSTSRQKSELIDPAFVGRRRAVRWALSIAFVAALGASAIITHGGIRDWRDSVSLWRASVAANPECEHSHCLLGQALAADAQGLSDDEMPKALADAVRHLREAVRLRPDFAFAHMNLGAALLASGRPAEARASYAAALSHAAMFHSDELARLHAGFALACAFDGDMNEARHHIREADRLGLPIEQLRRLRSAIPN